MNPGVAGSIAAASVCGRDLPGTRGGMTSSRTHPERTPEPVEEKPVEEWTTGAEPMTGPQRSYLRTLAREAGEDPPEDDMSKADASELIERLQRATGRIPAHRDR